MFFGEGGGGVFVFFAYLFICLYFVSFCGRTAILESNIISSPEKGFQYAFQRTSTYKRTGRKLLHFSKKKKIKTY